MKLKPFNDRIIVKPLPDQTKPKMEDGVWVAKSDQNLTCTVESVGIQGDFEVGETVVINHGDELSFEGVIYYSVLFANVIARYV